MLWTFVSVVYVWLKKVMMEFLKLILCICFWLLWVSIAASRLFSSCDSRGYSWLQCTGWASQWLLLLQSMGSRARRIIVVAHGWVALRHVGSSCTRYAPWVPCIGRWILLPLDHQEAHHDGFLTWFTIWIFERPWRSWISKRALYKTVLVQVHHPGVIR